MATLVPQITPTQAGGTVVFIVCGGVKISLTEMEQYRGILRKELEDGKRTWEGTCNGEEWSIDKYEV